jgi:uncharacterized ferritin-like protein (DUF455 family)
MGMELRDTALTALYQDHWLEKNRLLGAVLPDTPVDPTRVLVPQQDIPGRPALNMVPPAQLKQRSVHTSEGRAVLIHALAHIEFNAINLALDVVWRFASMPEAFYREWMGVAQEESLHFDLLNTHLQSLGYQYGDFPTHDGLWDMAERTKEDPLARLALVPRTLEARGLDASPLVRHKLASGGDPRGAEIIDVILRDEIGHVAIGNFWYRWLCKQRGLDPLATFGQLARAYKAPVLKGPFNLSARRAAGFDEQELKALGLPY